MAGDQHHVKEIDIRIKAIVDNFDNYTNLTALSYWVGK